MALIERGHDLGLVSGPNGRHAVTPERLPLDPRLAARLGRGPEGGPAQVHVRHQWPPDSRTAGKRPMGADAAVGVRQLAQEPGCPCCGGWTRSGRIAARSAIATSRPAFHPIGFTSCRSASIPRSSGPAWNQCRCHPDRDFRFLFVGGTIFRKGIDLLLAAFARAFQPSDGIGLVIKDMGSASFYRGQTAEAQVAALRERGYPVEYIDRSLSEAELAGLYTRLRLPGPSLPWRRLRAAGRRGDGLRPAGDRHRCRMGMAGRR